MTPKLLPTKLTNFSLGLFSILTLFVIVNSHNSLDHLFSTLVQNHISPIWTVFFSIVTSISNPAFVIILAVLTSGYFIFKRRFLLVSWFLVTVGGADVVATLIKHLIGRSRPIHQLLPETGFSFPSIHTMSATLFVLLLLTFFKNRHRWLVIAAVIWVSLVALSRIYLGAHYLTDVLAGASLAIVWYQMTTFFLLKKTYQ